MITRYSTQATSTTTAQKATAISTRSFSPLSGVQGASEWGGAEGCQVGQSG